ncbi:hypothetical protein [Candidatus Poriferisodalis sp.]|uniref:hypothetical protein n=1 Tax=Candidatus Poriferisodalis sp. TaxID=3101277 RepID=UPI003B52856B
MTDWHDPQMLLEALALFGEPEATAHARLRQDNPSPIPRSLINDGRQFGIEVLPRWVGA